MDYPVVEHRSSRPGRWLRANRVKLALVVALAEGVLVLTGRLPALLALLLAAAVLAFYVLLGRTLRSDVGRHTSAVAALSQVLVAAVPVLVVVVGAVALLALGLLVVVALVALLARRR